MNKKYFQIMKALVLVCSLHLLSKKWNVSLSENMKTFSTLYYTVLSIFLISGPAAIITKNYVCGNSTENLRYLDILVKPI